MKNEKSAEKVAKKKVMTDEQTEMLLDQAMEKSKKQKTKQQPIRLDKLHPFENHPYKIVDDEAMEELKASIADVGLLNRILVRPLENTTDEYEIISGHRRVHAAELLGMKEVPAVVYFIDRDEATLLMVDSNNQRETLLPSEKAFAYKMIADALTHQGNTSGQLVPKSDDNRTTAKIGEAAGDSYKTVQRYIRLTNLVPELLKFVDEKKIAFSPAVELSFLSEDNQREVVDYIDDNEVFPSHSQTIRMHREEDAGTLDRERVFAILDELKPNQVETLKLPMAKIRELVPRGCDTPKDISEYIFNLLEAAQNRRTEQEVQKKPRHRDDGPCL